MPRLTTVADHTAAVLGLVPGALPGQRVPLPSALGTVLAEPLVSTADLPGFDNSAMDGYAVKAVDLSDTPTTVPVSADIPAAPQTGEQRPLVPGTAARIMTGAPIPPGADAVIKVEWTDGGTDAVTMYQPVEAGVNVRHRGEDVRAGVELLSAGTVMGPAQLSAAAAFGHGELLVHRRPRVCVISTGSELVEPGQPTSLPLGAIFDSNSFALQALASRADADAIRVVAVGDDDPAHARRVLDRAAETSDLIVTTGGVSAGAYEVMKDVLASEPTVQFLPVAMQPGRPQGLGTYAGVPILTFPGNPVSAFVSFKLFAEPLIRKLAGWTRPTPLWKRATLAERVMPRESLHTFPRAHLNAATNRVSLIGGPGSHLMAALARANCLISVPPGEELLHAEAEVQILTYG